MSSNKTKKKKEAHRRQLRKISQDRLGDPGSRGATGFATKAKISNPNKKQKKSGKKAKKKAKG